MRISAPAIRQAIWIEVYGSFKGSLQIGIKMKPHFGELIRTAFRLFHRDICALRF